MVIAMEVIEELPGPVIIITPPQEPGQRPHNVPILLFRAEMPALWLNGSSQRELLARTSLGDYYCSLCKDFIFLYIQFLSESQFCLLLNVKLGVKQFK